MKDFILVSVSPFYNGRGWTDIATGIDFERTTGIQPIRISKNKDLTGIQNSVRINNLLLLDGTIEKKSNELTIENINPEELTKEQFAVLAKKLKAGQEDPENEIKLAEAKEETKAVKKELTEVEAALKLAQEAQKEAEKALVEAKKEFHSKYDFTTKDVADYEVDDLKEILDAKEIKYTSGEKKASLVKKVTAPAK